MVRIREQFRAAIDADREAGRLRSLESYQRLFEGYEDVIAEEYARLTTPKKPPSSASALLDRLAEGDHPGYSRGDEIARGGMGAILKVRDEALRRDLAMKVVLEERTVGDPRRRTVFLRRFLEEAQVTAQLDHPGVVPVHELGVDEDGRLFFTMKLVKGRTLLDIFELVQSGEEDWTLTRAVQLFVRVCETLAFAHSKGVVHRDLKPANIMVGDFGEVYVMDWGLAKVLGAHAEPADSPDDIRRSLVVSEQTDEDSAQRSPRLTRAGDVLGTPPYMSVEQARGQALDARSDVYAIGAMLYELLTGHPPYGEPEKGRSSHGVLIALTEGPPAPLDERSRVDLPELVAITEKAMARELADRYQTAAELGTDLRHFNEGRVVSAHRTGVIVEIRKWIRRNPAFAGVVGTAAVLLLVSLFFIASLSYQSSRDRKRAREREEADDRAMRRARARGLASASRTAVDPQLSLLLAREAGRNSLLPEVVADLRRAVETTLVHVVLKGHEKPVRRARFSPSGDLVVTASEDKTARIYDLEGRVVAVLEGHDGPVWDAAFSPSGDRIVTASADGTVRIWSRSGEDLGKFRVPGSRVATAVYSPRGERILTVTLKGKARVWTPSGDGVDLVPKQKQWVTAAFFSRSGQEIMTVGKTGTVVVWDREGNQLRDSGRFPYSVSGAARSPMDDSLLLSVGDGTIRHLNLSGRELLRLDEHVPGRGTVAWSPSGKRILLASTGGVARLVDPAGRELAVLRGHTATIRSVGFRRDGAFAVTASADGTARIWNLRSREPRVLPGDRQFAFAAFASSSGDRIVTLATDGSARLWDFAGHGLAAPWDGFGYRDPRQLICARDRIVLIAPSRLRFAVWDGDGRKVRDVLLTRRVRTLDVSPSGDRLLTVSEDATARLRDEAGKVLVEFNRLGGPVTLARFAPSGDRILTAYRAGTARLWEATGREIARLSGHSGPIEAVAFSRSGDRILTGSTDRTARLWDADGNELLVLAGHGGTVTEVALSPASDRILTRSEFGEAALLWNADGEEIGVLEHQGPILAVAFSPSGDRILTASGDRTARVWDRDGRLLDILRGHASAIAAAAFTPDGNRILTLSRDRTARLWVARADELARAADERIQRDFTAEERRRYADLLGDAQAR